MSIQYMRWRAPTEYQAPFICQRLVDCFVLASCIDRNGTKEQLQNYYRTTRAKQ